MLHNSLQVKGQTKLLMLSRDLKVHLHFLSRATNNENEVEGAAQKLLEAWALTPKPTEKDSIIWDYFGKLSPHCSFNTLIDTYKIIYSQCVYYGRLFYKF